MNGYGNDSRQNWPFAVKINKINVLNGSNLSRVQKVRFLHSTILSLFTPKTDQKAVQKPMQKSKCAYLMFYQVFARVIWPIL
jgi:hypothetical protein